MIKLQLNKYKLVSLTHIVNVITNTLYYQRQELKYTMKRAEISAHIFILQELSRKVKIKFIQVEHKSDLQQFFFSINEMQAYILMLYKDDCIDSSSGYDMETMQELSVPCFKKLLN